MWLNSFPLAPGHLLPCLEEEEGRAPYACVCANNSLEKVEKETCYAINLVFSLKAVAVKKKTWSPQQPFHLSVGAW